MSDNLVSVQMSQPLCIMGTKDIKHLCDRIEELEAENNLLKTSGIIEAAVRNPSVMEYMQHWEGRAEAAEAKLAKAVEALSAIDQYGSDTLSGRADGPDDRSWQREGVLEMTRRARTTLAELKGGNDE